MKSLCLVWLLTFGCSTTVIAGEPLFDSIAGTGAAENNGDAGPASAINIGKPTLASRIRGALAQATVKAGLRPTQFSGMDDGHARTQGLA